jgi:RNA polymerase sigma-70 factor (ECF subfamily)
MAIYVDDRELIAAHRAGDSEAFDELVREYRTELAGHAHRKLRCDAAAEDAVQETLIRAYRALPNFDGEYLLGPWLHRIMANVCIDEANRRYRDGEKVDQYAAQPTARRSAPSVEDELGLEIDDAALESALGDLSDPYREALVLRFVDDLDYDQVAALSGVSEQNARARVSRARSAMRSAMKGVAILPVLLFGLLKRGEKAAAAATSTAGAVSVSAGSTATSVTATVATQAAPALSSVAEVAAVVTHVAPNVVPIIAKAAVGIGLAAAVLTPTSDSAVHQAVESFTEGTAGVIVSEVEQGEDGELIPLTVVVTKKSGQTEQIVIETLSPYAEQDLPSVQAENPRVETTPVVNGSFIEGSASSDLILWTEAGAGRYYAVGTFDVLIDGVVISGDLVGASSLRLASRDGANGTTRFDGVFEIDGVDGTQATLQLLGFATGDALELELDGFFSVVSSDGAINPKGTFTGSINLSPGAGSASLFLTP